MFFGTHDKIYLLTSSNYIFAQFGSNNQNLKKTFAKNSLNHGVEGWLYAPFVG